MTKLATTRARLILVATVTVLVTVLVYNCLTGCQLRVEFHKITDEDALDAVWMESCYNDTKRPVPARMNNFQVGECGVQPRARKSRFVSNRRHAARL